MVPQSPGWCSFLMSDRIFLKNCVGRDEDSGKNYGRTLPGLLRPKSIGVVDLCVKLDLFELYQQGRVYFSSIFWVVFCWLVSSKHVLVIRAANPTFKLKDEETRKNCISICVFECIFLSNVLTTFFFPLTSFIYAACTCLHLCICRRPPTLTCTRRQWSWCTSKATPRLSVGCLGFSLAALGATHLLMRSLEFLCYSSHLDTFSNKLYTFN